MNYNSAHKKADLLEYQTDRLQDLIQEIIKCCDDRKLFESSKFLLPYAELKCLLLFNSERYLTVKNIAQALDVAKSRVTKLISGLEDKGLVHSVDDPKDARVKLIGLTAAGKAKAEEIGSYHRYLHREILAQLSGDERSKVLSCLELLRSAMEVVKGKFV